MRSRHGWLDDAAEFETLLLTRRGILGGSIKLVGAGALALTLANSAARDSLVFAQDASTPEAGAEGEAAGEIQVGTTEDAAAGAEAEGEAAAGAEAEGEAAAGAQVSTVPSTGVGAALGPSLGGVIGAIGLAAATGAAALFARRATEPNDAAE